MVSFQAPLSPKNLDQQRKTISYLETSPSKKRKWDDQYHHDLNKNKPTPKTSSAVDLRLETPYSSEWQHCLDIESGEIHFYNTRTKKRTHKDPRRSELERPSHMSLDLELNLPCGDDHSNNHVPSHSGIKNPSDHSRTKPKTLSLFTTNSSVSPAVEGEEEVEMVAAACKRCHMLVVLCKSSPTCPNCKFMHPLESSPVPKFMIKPGLGLSC